MEESNFLFDNRFTIFITGLVLLTLIGLISDKIVNRKKKYNECCKGSNITGYLVMGWLFLTVIVSFCLL